MTVRCHARVLEVADLRAAQLALLDRAEGELHGLVAVRVRRLHLHDRAWSSLDHRHRGDDARLLVEQLGHAQLRTNDAFQRSPSEQTVAAPEDAAMRSFAGDPGLRDVRMGDVTTA